MRENIFILFILLIIHPIFSYTCHLEGDNWCDRACNVNTYKDRCPSLKKVCDERATGKYCYVYGIKGLKSSIWRSLKDCDLLDEFDKKKCNPGFYPKRTCIVINKRWGEKEIRRECYAIDQECRKKSKNDEDFKKCVETEKKQIDSGNIKADIDCEVEKKKIPDNYMTNACYPYCKGGTFQKETCTMKCLNLRHYPVCCDVKNNDKYYVCKNYYVFDPNYLNGIPFVRTKKKCELCGEKRHPKCNEFGWV